MRQCCFVVGNDPLRFMVIAPEKLSYMSADELREAVQTLLKTVTFKQTTIDKLTYETAYLKRLKSTAQFE